MKLLIVTPYFYPKTGGLETYAWNFSKALQKKYHWKIVVVTSNHKNNKTTVERISNIKIYRLPRLFKLSNTPINPFWYFSMKRIIEEEKPDVINAHTPVPFIADIAALASGNIPFVVTYHAYTLLKYKSIFFNQIIRVYKLFEYFLFKKAKKIILVSEASKEVVPTAFRKKTVVINNSISRHEVSKKKRKQQTGNTLCFISSLDKTHEWKGLQEIIQATALYNKNYDDQLSVTVIGSGNYKKEYQKLAKKIDAAKHITFSGAKYGKDKYSIMQKSSAGIVYPKSSNDAFPTVILEYWAQSLPVIASNIMPLRKILKNNTNAVFVKPNNPEALAKSLYSVLHDQNTLENLITGGKKTLQADYLIEDTVSKLHAALL